MWGGLKWAGRSEVKPTANLILLNASHLTRLCDFCQFNLGFARSTAWRTHMHTHTHTHSHTDSRAHTHAHKTMPFYKSPLSLAYTNSKTNNMSERQKFYNLAKPGQRHHRFTTGDTEKGTKDISGFYCK